MILAGRHINDNMGIYVAQQVVKLMTQRRIPVVDAQVLVLGLTFKENCPDLRNTRVIDIIHEFTSYNATVDVFDPWVNAEEAWQEYGIRRSRRPSPANMTRLFLRSPITSSKTGARRKSALSASPMPYCLTLNMCFPPLPWMAGCNTQPGQDSRILASARDGFSLMPSRGSRVTKESRKNKLSK